MEAEGSIDHIERVADERLWITDINSVSRAAFAQRGIDYNLNLALKPISDRRRAESVTYAHIPFRDGKAGEEVQAQFNEAVTTAVQRLRETDDRMVLNCAAGVSRSAAVAATVIAVFDDVTFQRALSYVENSRPRVDPYKSLYTYGTVYVTYRTDQRW